MNIDPEDYAPPRRKISKKSSATLIFVLGLLAWGVAVWLFL
jgi:hypothetical protein